MKNYLRIKYKDFLKFNEDIENVILYHGSDTSFDEFDDSKISTGDSSELLGKGYYLTNNLEVARHYAKLKAKNAKVVKYNNNGIFGSPVPEYSDDADEYANKTFKVNKFKVEGNILNLQTFILDDKFIEFLRQSFNKHTNWGDKIFWNCINYMRNNKDKIHNYRGELLYVIQQLVMDNKEMLHDVINHIKDIGYDGLKYLTDKSFENTGEHWNYVIYNKTAIRKIDSKIELRKSGSLLALYVDNIYVGKCNFIIKTRLPLFMDKKGLYIHDFEILDKYSGLGYYKYLIQKVIEYANKNQFQVIYLEVLKDNIKAIHIYQKYGFKILTELDKSYRKSYDMALPLNA